jgi:hypothetical protein
LSFLALYLGDKAKCIYIDNNFAESVISRHKRTILCQISVYLALIILVGGVFYLPSSQFNLAEIHELKSGKMRIPELRKTEEVKELIAAIPKGSVVLASRATRNFIVAFHDVMINGTLNIIGNEPVLFKKKIRPLFKEAVTREYVRNALAEWKTDFVLLGPKEKSAVIDRYNLFPFLKKRVEANISDTVYLDGRYILYQVIPELLTTDGATQNERSRGT